MISEPSDKGVIDVHHLFAGTDVADVDDAGFLIYLPVIGIVSCNEAE